MTQELIIDKSNFDQYFFDVRLHKPKKGQVMARYAAIAEFIDGYMKRDMIDLVRNVNNKAEAAVKVMRKLGCAIEKDSIRIPLEMVRDFRNGMTVEEVAQKPYKYTIEVFYYTEKQYVPDDPHWSVITLLNYCDNEGTPLKIDTKFVDKEGKEVIL